MDPPFLFKTFLKFLPSRY